MLADFGCERSLARSDAAHIPCAADSASCEYLHCSHWRTRSLECWSASSSTRKRSRCASGRAVATLRNEHGVSDYLLAVIVEGAKRHSTVRLVAQCDDSMSRGVKR